MAATPAPLWAEWQAYYELEPWGDERADLRSGLIAATVHNVWRGKGARAKTALDFCPLIERPKAAPQSLDDARRQVDLFFRAAGRR